MNVSTYIAEEVHRQGFKRGTAIHTEMAINMALAWGEWPEIIGGRFNGTRMWLVPRHIVRLGALVMPDMNAGGFRQHNVGINGRPEVKFAPWEEVPRLIDTWCEAAGEERLKALEAYIEFEMIHPFGDGNGRTGKILFNWMNGTMDDPIWPDSPKEWRVP